VTGGVLIEAPSARRLILPDRRIIVPTARRRRPRRDALGVLGAAQCGQLSGGTAPMLIARLQGWTVALYSIAESAYVTQVAGVTSAWADLSPSANNFAATVGQQPTFTATDATLANRGSITGDGATQQMHSALDLAPPGTTPIRIYTIAKVVTYVALRRLMAGATTNTLRWRLTNTTNVIAMDNGTATNANTMVAGTWYRSSLVYTNTTSDSLRIGNPAAVTGGNAGNNDPTSFCIFADPTPANFASCAYSMILVVTGSSSLGLAYSNLESALDLWATRYYCGTVTL